MKNLQHNSLDIPHSLHMPGLADVVLSGSVENPANTETLGNKEFMKEIKESLSEDEMNILTKKTTSILSEEFDTMFNRFKRFHWESGNQTLIMGNGVLKNHYSPSENGQQTNGEVSLGLYSKFPVYKKGFDIYGLKVKNISAEVFGGYTYNNNIQKRINGFNETIDANKISLTPGHSFVLRGEVLADIPLDDDFNLNVGGGIQALFTGLPEEIELEKNTKDRVDVLVANLPDEKRGGMMSQFMVPVRATLDNGENWQVQFSHLFGGGPTEIMGILGQEDILKEGGCLLLSFRSEQDSNIIRMRGHLPTILKFGRKGHFKPYAEAWKDISAGGDAQLKAGAALHWNRSVLSAGVNLKTDSTTQQWGQGFEVSYSYYWR